MDVLRWDTRDCSGMPCVGASARTHAQFLAALSIVSGVLELHVELQ